GDSFRIMSAVDDGGGGRRAQRGIDRQTENGFRMQFEFALILAGHRDHAGIVRTRADFGEPDLVALDEQFDAEQAESTEVVGYAERDVLCLLQRHWWHRLRLP